MNWNNKPHRRIRPFLCYTTAKAKNELAIYDDAAVFEPKKTRLFSGFLKRDQGGVVLSCVKITQG